MLFDLIVTEALFWMIFHRDLEYLNFDVFRNILVMLCVLFFEGLILYNIYRIVNNYFVLWITIQFLGAAFTMFIFMFNGPKF